MPSLKSFAQKKFDLKKKSKSKESRKYPFDVEEKFTIFDLPVFIHKNINKKVIFEIKQNQTNILEEVEKIRKRGSRVIRVDIVLEKGKVKARYRVRDPKKCIKTRRIVLSEKKDVDMIRCQTKEGEWVDQSKIRPLTKARTKDNISTIDKVPDTAIFLTSKVKNINFPQLCVDGIKKWIIKSIPMELHKNEALYIVDHKKAYGIVRLNNNGTKVKKDSNDWKEIRRSFDKHRIPPELFDEWFRDKDIYVYECKPVAKYISPFDYKYERGVQTFDLSPRIKTFIKGIPELKQKDDYTCTETSARMIRAFYNKYLQDIDYISEKCDTLDILAPCMYNDFYVKLYGVRQPYGEEGEKQPSVNGATMDMLKKEIIMGRPLLVRFQFPGQDGGDGHTVVVRGFNKNGFYFNDPAKGVYPSIQFYTYEEFERYWAKTNNMAMFLEPKV